MRRLPAVTSFFLVLLSHYLQHLGSECVKSAALCVSQVLDWVQIDNNFSEFADSITLRRIQENSSAGRGGERWQITGDLSAPGSPRSVDKAGLMEVSGEKKREKDRIHFELSLSFAFSCTNVTE